MEVLVLIDFEGTMGDEMTVRTGDVVKKVTKAQEEGWLDGELRGSRGIFPANFVMEVPVYLIGENKREPRSLRKSRMMQQKRKCEVSFAYTPLNEDELELVVGETITILREIEEGWWMGMKEGKVGAFPSNFVKEIFVPKDAKGNEGKTRPKLTDAVFSKETKMPQRASVRRKIRNTEFCQVMFDYTALTEDELDLRTGDIVSILTKETEDEGWWEGEVNGRRGFFPDNFVMVIPPQRSQPGASSQPPARQDDNAEPVTLAMKAMDKGGPTKTKDEKPDVKDLRSNPPIKVKLPAMTKPTPPPVKDKPVFLHTKSNGELVPPAVARHPEDRDGDQFEGLPLSTEKLSHPTAGRAKPPQRRPPSGLVSPGHVHNGTEETEPKSPTQKLQAEKSHNWQKVAKVVVPSLNKPDSEPKAPPAAHTTPPRGLLDSRATTLDKEPSLEELQAEIKDLKMALDLLKTRQERDIQEVKEELQVERHQRMILQEEVHSLRMKH